MIILKQTTVQWQTIHLPGKKLKNLDSGLCLDQGPVPGHTPIAFICHYYGPQVRVTDAMS